MTASSDAPAPPPPRKRSRWKRWLVGLAVFGVLVWLAIPFVVSWIGAGIATSRASEILGSSVDVGGFGFGWFSGVDLEEVTVAQPADFADAPAAFEVKRVQAQVGIWGAVRGRYDVFARIESPRLRVVRGREGEINWLQMLAPKDEAAGGGGDRRPDDAERSPREPSEPNDSEESGALPPLSIDFELSDGLVEIHDRQSGAEHRMKDLQVRMLTDGWSLPLNVSLSAQLEGGGQSGSLKLESTFDPATEATSTLVLSTENVDLAPYQPLLRSFGVDLERVEGVFGGELTAELRPASSPDAAREVVLGGEMHGLGVHVAGPMLGEMEIHVDDLELKPALRIDPESGTVSNDELRIDAGFVRLFGVKAEEQASLFGDGQPGAIGLEVVVLLEELGQQKGILPADFVASGGHVRTAVALRGDLNPTSPSFLAEPVQVRMQGHGRGVELTSETLKPRMVPKVFDFTVPATVNADALTGSVEGGSLQFGESHLGFDAALDGERLQADVEGLLDQPYVRVLAGAFGPEKLAATGQVAIDSTIDAAWPLSTDDLATLLQGVGTETEVSLPALAFLDNELSGLKVGLAVVDGNLTVKLPTPASLNGGQLGLEVTLNPDAALGMPMALDLSWKGGSATGSATPLLRYAVPFLAGLGADVNALDDLDFAAGVDLGLRLAGPLQKSEGATWLQFLTHYEGAGDLALRDGSFTPSQQFSELTKLTGSGGKIAFSSLSTSFDVSGGEVRSKAIDVQDGGSQYSIAGATKLDGGMDYRFDLRKLLEGRGTGDKILQALGDRKLEAVIGGTLQSPALDLGASAEQLLQGLSGDLLEQLGSDPAGAIDRVKGLFGQDKDGGR